MPEPLSTLPTQQGASSQNEPEITVIPEQFYGAALKAKIPEAGDAPKTETKPTTTPPKVSKTVLVIAVGAMVLLGIGGAFVYFNQGLLFQKTPPQAPAPPSVEAPKPPQAPPAPESLVATSTDSRSASLSWAETAADVVGFRVDRADGQGVFAALTSLPSRSVSFLDTSVQPGQSYRYRVIAVSAGGESPPSGESSVTIAALPPPPPEQPKLPPAGLDTDSDGLTDLEEALFGATVQNPDTDGDGFLDGNEVFHLYNPGGRAPGRLSEAGFVKKWTGSIGWTLFAPTSWNVTLDTQDGSRATFATGRGELFKLSLQDNPKKQSLLDWYLESHPGIQAGQALKYRSKKGLEGIIGADLLTTYVPWGDKVLVFFYDLVGQSFINYRTTYAMMLNSLDLMGVPLISTSVTSAQPLPFEPGATTTGVVAQPVPIVAPSATGTLGGGGATTSLP